MNGVQIFLFAERELQIIVGAVIGKDIAVSVVDGGIDVPFLVKAGRGKTKFLQKRRGKLMHHVKIHRLVMEIDDRHFDLDADIAFLFLFCRAYKAVVKTAENFFSCHMITLQVCEDLIDQLHFFLAVDIFVMMFGACFDQLSLAER